MNYNALRRLAGLVIIELARLCFLQAQAWPQMSLNIAGAMGRTQA
jgi:hypothetical protein